jgi:hypothetical protein
MKRRVYKGAGRAGRQRVYDVFFDEWLRTGKIEASGDFDEWLRTGKIEAGGEIARSAAFRAFAGLATKVPARSHPLSDAAHAAGRDARGERIRVQAIARNLNRADRHTLQTLFAGAGFLPVADLKGDLSRRGYVGEDGLLTELGRSVARASLELERSGELQP